MSVEITTGAFSTDPILQIQIQKYQGALYLQQRCIHLSLPMYDTTENIHGIEMLTEVTEPSEEDNESKTEAEEDDRLPGGGRIKMKLVDVETSMEYMKSKSFQLTYKGDKVWEHYRRNHRGQFRPKKTRHRCIAKQKLITGNPCPICRDEYLVIHYKHIELLKQFVNPYSGEVFPCNKLQVCQVQYKKILVAVQQAYEKGYLQMRVPFKKYNYDDYYPQSDQKDAR